MAIEYRIQWETRFQGASGEGDWVAWHDPDTSAEDVQDQLSCGSGALPQGLEEAIEDSGFGWSVETREAEGENDG